MGQTCGVLPGHFAGKFTGHIYWHAALHSCSSPSSCCDLTFEYLETQVTCICFGGEVDDCDHTVCANRNSLLAVEPGRRKVTTLVIIAKRAKYASDYDKCSTQRFQRIKASFENRVLETRAHLSRRIPHLVSELSVKIYAERQRSVWAERLEASLGSSKRR